MDFILKTKSRLFLTGLSKLDLSILLLKMTGLRWPTLATLLACVRTLLMANLSMSRIGFLKRALIQTLATTQAGRLSTSQ